MDRELTHYVVLDFEATCDGATPPEPQEIIEFPSVLLSSDFEVIDEFESFVRPVHHPQLTPFCTELTGITQAEVDGAPTFSEVFAAHQAWLESHGLPLEGELGYALVTCGDWDLRTALPAQMAATDPPMLSVPMPYRRWINVKEPFRKWRPKLKRAGMRRMLEELGLELEGRHHRGIDDSRNIAKILRALAVRHQTLAITTELPASRYPDLPLRLQRNQKQAEVVLGKRAMATLLGLASEAFRRGAKEAFHEGRPLREDADLRDLPAHASIQID